jgi:MFS transporter, FHS family, L-fucose permease
MSSDKKSMFLGEDGKSLFVTFILVSSLFLLWGFCNGMIDVMDKHFQDELHLSLAQSAWVQFAHYLGYFLMALPAGWLAIKLGYKGGIITGLMMVAAGGLWFVPATWISHAAQEGEVSRNVAFAAFLLGVCLIASGLTFLETIANPYTTVLGDKKYAATRINLAQSCNGIGWIFGPIVGAQFFYSENAAETIYIPYVGVAVVVLILSVIFYFARMPDIKSEDDYQLDKENGAAGTAAVVEKRINRPLVYILLVLNIALVIWSFGTILRLILETIGAGPHLMGLASLVPRASGTAITAENSVQFVVWAVMGLAIVVVAFWMAKITRSISRQSIWSHPHFTGATLAQFFYVAAQAGIFSFFINYMTSEVPPISAEMGQGWLGRLLEANDAGSLSISDQGAANLASLGFVCFLVGRFTGAGILKKFSPHKVLGLYGLLNVIVCGLVFLKLGWISVIGVFLCYFLMSIMFPTIFALGIFGLGVRAKEASAYIVMAIMGGALMPKIMGAVADEYDMSRSFIVPLFCFVVVAAYGFLWPRFAQAENMNSANTATGH